MSHLVSSYISTWMWWGAGSAVVFAGATACRLIGTVYENLPAVRRREAARQQAERERLERVTRAYLAGERWWDL